MDSYADFLRFVVITLVIAVPALAFQWLFNPGFFRRGSRSRGGDDGSTSYSASDPHDHSHHGGHDGGGWGGDSGDSGGGHGH